MRIPDWFIYSVALVAVLYVLLSQNDDDANAPQTIPEEYQLPDVTLPAPSIFDEEVLVDVEIDAGPGVGTAFAVAKAGMWLTARHVVDGCSDLAIRVGPSRIVPVDRYEIYGAGDMALLYTDGGPDATRLDLGSEKRVGQTGFHIGYPQGRPGEVTSRLLARSTMVSRGRYNVSEPVLAWAEAGRTRNLNGSLGGISGGPVFDEDGEVIGVTVAESPRRGRIYTTSPAAVLSFLDSNADYAADGEQARSLTTTNYGGEGDRLRRNLTIVKVLCQARE
ncbi:MAG: serine protease [Ponticaulis sp.]|nr:serine protease [Ponticaulis sp.]